MPLNELRGEDVEEQLRNDTNILVKEGDERVVKQTGTIKTGAGDEVPVDFEFIRKRNKLGGVDVVMKMPSLEITSKKE